MTEQIMSAEEFAEQLSFNLVSHFDEMIVGEDGIDMIKARDTSLTAAKDKEIARLREALEELVGPYNGGANSAFEDPYIMERAQAALAQHKEGE